MIDAWKIMTNDPKRLARLELQDTQRKLLQAESELESATAIRNLYAGRIERLKETLANWDKAEIKVETKVEAESAPVGK